MGSEMCIRDRIYLLAMHWIDLYWLVMPQYDRAFTGPEGDMIVTFGTGKGSVVLRHNQPVQINPVHCQKVNHGDEHQVFVPSHRPAHHEQEGNEKVTNKQDDGKYSPAVCQVHTVFVPERFFRNICVPDQQELAKCDVSPEHDEAMHQLAHVVIVFDSDFVRDSSGPL